MKKLTLDWTLITLTCVAMTLAGVAWWKGGQDLALEGLRQGFQTLVSVTPMLLAAFLTAGLTNVLISQELVERWLASSAGWRGILIGCIGGALIPGAQGWGCWWPSSPQKIFGQYRGFPTNSLSWDHT
jgi:hypothetical protein